MFLTQVRSQGFVFLHVHLEIHTRSRGHIWSKEGNFWGEYEVKKKVKRLSVMNFLNV